MITQLLQFVADVSPVMITTFTTLPIQISQVKMFHQPVKIKKKNTPIKNLLGDLLSPTIWGGGEWTEWTNFEPRIQSNLPLHLPTTSGDGSIKTDDIRRNAKKGHLLKQHQGTFSWTSGPESDGQHQKDTPRKIYMFLMYNLSLEIFGSKS